MRRWVLAAMLTIAVALGGTSDALACLRQHNSVYVELSSAKYPETTDHIAGRGRCPTRAVRAPTCATSIRRTTAGRERRWATRSRTPCETRSRSASTSSADDQGGPLRRAARLAIASAPLPVTETGTRAREPDEAGYAETDDGLRLYWEVHGSGEPTIVLLPPTPISHSRIWKAQVAASHRHHRVVVYDGRGNGRSDSPDPAGPVAWTAGTRPTALR